ncbi:hypothetical protein TcWFU_006620 [Taenia crassiceps]|uniref:Uncharacterized protein n=1 Tax=Taenia crassiceps TaxID=6207 RepID=A0ABR4QLN2_9CEST
MASTSGGQPVAATVIRRQSGSEEEADEEEEEEEGESAFPLLSLRDRSQILSRPVRHNFCFNQQMRFSSSEVPLITSTRATLNAAGNTDRMQQMMHAAILAGKAVEIPALLYSTVQLDLPNPLPLLRFFHAVLLEWVEMKSTIDCPAWLAISLAGSGQTQGCQRLARYFHFIRTVSCFTSDPNAESDIEAAIIVTLATTSKKELSSKLTAAISTPPHTSYGSIRLDV